jgi:tetratricopeptide (TPR) repeat protein
MFGEEVAKAALRTTIGKPAGPIKGITGYHIIVVEGRKFDFPPKYYKARYRCLSCRHQWEVEDERKAKPTKCPKCNGKRLKVVWRGSKEVLEDVRRVKVERAWFEFQSKMRADAKIEILDPELAAYKAEVYGDTKEAIRLYNKALKYAETLEVPLVFPAAILFRIGLLYERQKGKEELALKAYRRALSYDEDAVLHIRIATLLKSKGKKEEALRELKKASEVVGDPSDRIELARLYEELGMKAEAERQRKLYESEMKERFSGGSM